jgi:hypothetical protein
MQLTVDGCPDWRGASLLLEVLSVIIQFDFFAAAHSVVLKGVLEHFRSRCLKSFDMTEIPCPTFPRLL